MKRNFQIVDGIYLVQSNYELDLHNNFDFAGLNYSVAMRTLTLEWTRSSGEWVSPETPAAISIIFNTVTEFRFYPRSLEIPFTEDDCIDQIGYWTDDDFCDGVFTIPPNQTADPVWLTAIEFNSGAVMAVQAMTAVANVTE